RDIILPLVEFETVEFNRVLDAYKGHTWYSKHFDEDLFEDSKFKLEPVINGFKFKFSLGGIHGDTRAKAWESNDEYEVVSIDVAAYYPSMIIEHMFVPEHLD